MCCALILLYCFVSFVVFCINLFCLIAFCFVVACSSSSSPLLSLVTSTSEISHQPVHTYTTYIQYDKGVDRTGRQGIEEKYSIT